MSKRSPSRKTHRGTSYQTRRKRAFPRVWERDKGICQICFKPVHIGLALVDPQNKMAPSIDHILPLSRGGGWALSNLRLAHKGCNSHLGGLNANPPKEEVSDRWLSEEDSEQGRGLSETA